jgi:multiple sugar transport system permease protein
MLGMQERLTGLERHRKRKWLRREELAFYLFISPWLLGFLALKLGPIIASFALSFTSYDVISTAKLVGLQNYRVALGSDALFWKSLQVTLIFTILSVPANMIAGLLVALLMNQKVRGISFIRTIYFLPSVITGVPVAVLWIGILSPNGVINGALRRVGIQGPNWLYSETWVIPAFVIMGLWGIGGTMMIYLAALKGIPQHLYEAAEVDGAGVLPKFWHITIPMITPVIFFNLVVNIIASFQVFTTAFVMTDGGPNNASLFYVLHLYRNAFSYFKMGYASALAWVLFVIILMCTLLVFKSSPLWVYYEGMREGKPS